MKKPVSKKNAAAKARARRAGDRAAARPATTGWKPVILVVGLVAGVLGVTFGTSMLRHRAVEALAAGADALPEGDRVTINWPVDAPWLDEQTRQDLLSRTAFAAFGRRGSDPLSVAPLQAVAADLYDLGWFAEPPRVRRDGSGRIAIDAEWRRAAAVVRTPRGDWLIGWDGFPMRALYPSGASGFIVLTGSAMSPDPAADPQIYRSPWPGADVQAGLSLLKLIAERDTGSILRDVASIDVGRFGREGEVEIVTLAGGRVVWGSPPGIFRAGEINDDLKIRRLQEIAARYGRIDGNASRLELAGIVVEIDRLPTDGAPTAAQTAGAATAPPATGPSPAAPSAGRNTANRR